MSNREHRGINRGFGIMRRPGRLRKRLEQLLYAAGFQVRAAEIAQNSPAYRTPMRDGIAWEVYGSKIGEAGTVQLHSWDTMAECVRNGITASARGDSFYEVSAKERLYFAK